MKKLVIELCCVIVLAACGNGKEQNTVEEDSTAKALLQGALDAHRRRHHILCRSPKYPRII